MRATSPNCIGILCGIRRDTSLNASPAHSAVTVCPHVADFRRRLLQTSFLTKYNSQSPTTANCSRLCTEIPIQSPTAFPFTRYLSNIGRLLLPLALPFKPAAQKSPNVPHTYAARTSFGYFFPGAIHHCHDVFQRCTKIPKLHFYLLRRIIVTKYFDFISPFQSRFLFAYFLFPYFLFCLSNFKILLHWYYFRELGPWRFICTNLSFYKLSCNIFYICYYVREVIFSKVIYLKLFSTINANCP